MTKLCKDCKKVSSGRQRLRPSESWENSTVSKDKQRKKLIEALKSLEGLKRTIKELLDDCKGEK